MEQTEFKLNINAPIFIPTNNGIPNSLSQPPSKTTKVTGVFFSKQITNHQTAQKSTGRHFMFNRLLETHDKPQNHQNLEKTETPTKTIEKKSYAIFKPSKTTEITNENKSWAFVATKNLNTIKNGRIRVADQPKKPDAWERTAKIYMESVGKKKIKEYPLHNAEYWEGEPKALHNIPAKEILNKINEVEVIKKVSQNSKNDNFFYEYLFPCQYTLPNKTQTHLGVIEIVLDPKNAKPIHIFLSPLQNHFAHYEKYHFIQNDTKKEHEKKINKIFDNLKKADLNKTLTFKKDSSTFKLLKNI